MAQILITEFIDDAAVALLRQHHDVFYDPERPDADPVALRETRALIVRNRTQVTAGLLQGAPNLRCVGRLGVGLDNIDLVACADLGIAVYPATGANDLAVAEYVIATALMLLRGAYSLSSAVGAGQWPRAAAIGREAQGKRLGLVGFGGIARATAVRARALGFTIAATDANLADSDPAWAGATRTALPHLLETSDVISLHVPLNASTRGLIDAKALATMRPGAILINTSRGGVVDEAALAAALGSGALAGAALDVFETEPLSAEAGRRFEGLANLILTPHIAGVTEESNVRVSRLTAENVLRHLEATA